MKIGILVSEVFENEWGLNYKELLSSHNLPFHTVSKLPSDLNDADLAHIEADCFIVLGVHSLADYPKRLCVHPCGNWGEKWILDNGTSLGGFENTLSMSSAVLLRSIYLELLRQNRLFGYKVNVECTHHGPALSRPLVFLEIGSSSVQWSSLSARKTIIRTLKNLRIKRCKQTAIAFGGDHYMRNVTSLLRKDIQITHMCSSAHLHHVSEKMLREVITKSKEKVDFAIIDLAKVGQHHQRIISLLDEIGLPYKYLHAL